MHLKFRTAFGSSIFVVLGVISALFLFVIIFGKRSAIPVEVDLGLVSDASFSSTNSADALVMRRLAEEIDARTNYFSRFGRRTFTYFRITWYQGKTLNQSSWNQLGYSEDFSSLDIRNDDKRPSYKYRNVTRDKIKALAAKGEHSPVKFSDLKSYGCSVEVFSD